MARLPSALKRKNEGWEMAAQLRRENLDRLNAGQAPQPLPEPTAPVVELVDQGEQRQEQVQHEQGGPQQLGQQDVIDPAEVERLRNRLSTSEGMLRAEGERNRQLQQEAREREQQLRDQVENLQRQQPTEPMPLEQLKRYVTNQQLVEFGEDQCRLIVATVQSAAGAVTRGAVQQEVASMREELNQHREALQRSQETAFWSAVNSALPRWREINSDAGFLRWLGERDVLAGRTRQEVLNEARTALDADRVVAIFNTYQQSQPKPLAARDPSRRVIPNGRSSAAEVEAPADKIVSRTWIAEQNRLHSQGYYRRRQTEWQTVQETIDKAAREGRIR